MEKLTKRSLSDLRELELLDLRKCASVRDIVVGMSKCSFGARMLGEAFLTIEQLVGKNTPPLLIYDGKTSGHFCSFLKKMVEDRYFSRMLTSEEYHNEKTAPEKNLVVVGVYSERFEDSIYSRPEHTIFINKENRCKPGQIIDGYFPNAVFSDPNYIMPIIAACLDESRKGKKTTVTDFLGQLDSFDGLAKHVLAGAETFKSMVKDKDCFVFLTLSGAMTIAKMGLVIVDMVDLGMVHCIASTGALMAHGFVESIGLKHYKHDPKLDDTFLTENFLNRVTDTLEPEDNLNHIQAVLDTIFAGIDPKEPLSPSILHKKMGKYLVDNFPNDRGILKSCYERNVPVIVPAFVDSEIGNDLCAHNYRREMEGKPRFTLDMELDTRLLIDTTVKAERTGIFSIGGGVPRNYIQNLAPQIELLNYRIGMNLKMNRFRYGCKICPDQMYLGHLSGCTYSEGMTWRKMDAAGRFSSIQNDATQVWPFIVKYVMEAR